MASGSDIRRLVASAQGGLADAIKHDHAGKRRDLIAASQAQAACAIALAIDRLATVVLTAVPPDES